MKRRGFLAGLAAAIGLPALLKAGTMNDGQILKFIRPVSVPVSVTATFTAAEPFQFGDAVFMTLNGKVKPMKVIKSVIVDDSKWIIDAKY